MAKSFTQTQIDEANAKSIIDYVLSKGMHVKRAGKDYKIEEIGGGLYIDIDANKWHWWGEDKGGGIIQFVMEMENKNWKEAIITLLNLELSSEVKMQMAMDKSEQSKELMLPEKDKTMKHLFAYLAKTRGINKDIIQDYIDKGLLYQSKERNCVFLGKDENDEVKYAFIRGTNTSKRFLMEAPNSQKNVSFFLKGNSKRLFVFESIIDMMSYQTLLKMHGCKDELQSNFLSLGGVETLALERFLEKNQIEKITLCLDNDETGRKACHKIASEFKKDYIVTRHKPKCKDFNAELTELIEEEQEKQKNQENENNKTIESMEMEDNFL